MWFRFMTYLPEPPQTPVAGIQSIGTTDPSLCGKAGLRTRERQDGICHPVPCAAFPWASPQWPDLSAHFLAYRCGGSTGIAGVKEPAHLFPVSSAGRESIGGHLAAAAGLGPAAAIISTPPRQLRKVMKDLHKRPLLLDAAE